MKEFHITQTDFWVDGKKELILMAEVHYFRLNPAVWDRVLDLVAESGCNSLAFYVPWFVHEPEEGVFDFTGRLHPQNDLVSFLRLAQEKGLWLFPRIGPYIYSESANYGIPQWFLDHYPQARLMQYRDGSAVPRPHTLSVGHNHPDFLAAVSRWSEQALAVIAPFQMPDGLVFMIQACNEIPGEDTDDQNPQNLGLGNPEGRHPRFLRQKYETVSALNAAYHADFPDFTSVYPAQLAEKNPPLGLTDHLSYYYEHYFPDYFATLMEMYKGYGVRVPIVHNAYNPRAVSLHVHNKRRNPDLFVGVDCYYSLSGRLSAQSANYYCEYGPAYMEAFLRNAPWVVEQESGYWNDFPAVYGEELYLWNIWAVAGGYRGFSLYLFASGDNLPGMGFFGSDHNWQAPVTADGQKRESFDHIRRSLRDIRENQTVLTAPRLHDMALGHSSAPGLIWRPLSAQSANAYFQLSQSGFAPEICDYEGMSLAELQKRPVLWVVCDGVMDKAAQEKLWAYANAGGRLVLQGGFPQTDRDGNQVSFLAAEMGVTTGPYQDLKQDQNKLVLNIDGKPFEHYIGRTVQDIDWKSARIAAHTFAGQPALFAGGVGRGQIVLAPFHMDYLFHSQQQVVRAILGLCGCAPLVQGQKNLRAIVKANGQAVVFNVHPLAVTETLAIRGQAYTVNLAPLSFQILSL